ncbi:MAG: GNAT family N-acetyltransferase [Bacteroidia bacterium]|nr:GNAT family N-acetyltransferase [Bacteroidia bacterium]
MSAPYLENNFIRLSLLDLSNYEHLLPIAQQEKLIQYSPSDISSPDTLKKYVQIAVDGYYQGTVIPFIIYDKAKNQYAGSTRFGNIDQENKVLHIGWTWIGKQFHGTGLNTNMKFLMLQYAFEDLKFEKVEFRIDERNAQSRKAIEKIGAKLDGILRSDTVMLDTFRRNTCCYSILKEEWPEVKTRCFKGH